MSHAQYVAIPGQVMVPHMDNDTIIFGALRAVTSFNFNTAIVTMNASLADLSGHPGSATSLRPGAPPPPR